jgi:hypothetical protein
MVDDVLTVRLRQQLIQIQVTLCECLRQEYERGEMTADQFEWIIDYYANLDQYDEEEALAQLEAWFTWRNGTNPKEDDENEPHHFPVP